MPDSRFPDPTKEQLAWMETARPVLKDGSVQQPGELLAFVVASCVDSRPHPRVVKGQAGDYLSEQLWDSGFVQEVRDVFTYTNEEGQKVVNLKALNMWRYNWLRPYGNTMAGGRYAQDMYSTYYTLVQHKVRLMAVFLTQHDLCAAAEGQPKGTRLDWELSIQATVHDLWRTKVARNGSSVPIYTGTTRTESTKLEQLNLALEFNHDAYDKLVPFCDPYQVALPDEECTSTELVELNAWSEAMRACTVVEDYQDWLMTEHNRWLREQDQASS